MVFAKSGGASGGRQESSEHGLSVCAPSGFATHWIKSGGQHVRWAQRRECLCSAVPREETRVFGSTTGNCFRQIGRRNPASAEDRQSHSHVPPARYLRGGILSIHALLFF